MATRAQDWITKSRSDSLMLANTYFRRWPWLRLNRFWNSRPILWPSNLGQAATNLHWRFMFGNVLGMWKHSVPPWSWPSLWEYRRRAGGISGTRDYCLWELVSGIDSGQRHFWHLPRHNGSVSELSMAMLMPCHKILLCCHLSRALANMCFRTFGQQQRKLKVLLSITMAR